MTEAQSQIPPEILAELQKHKAHRQQSCLVCGYQGLMGYTANKWPWVVAFFLCFLLTMFLGIVVTIIVVTVVTVLLSYVFKSKYHCPSCKSTLS